MSDVHERLRDVARELDAAVAPVGVDEADGRLPVARDGHVLSPHRLSRAAVVVVLATAVVVVAIVALVVRPDGSTTVRAAAPTSPDPAGMRLVLPQSGGWTVLDPRTGQRKTMRPPELDGVVVTHIERTDSNHVIVTAGGRAYLGSVTDTSITDLGPGDLALHAGGDRVWLVRDNRVSQMTTDGRLVLPATALPDGYMIADPPVASPSRLVLEQDQSPTAGQGRRMIVWTPVDREITELERVNHVIDIGGPPVAPTVAWVPVGCEMQAACELHLLNLASGEERVIDGPAGTHGFIGGGEFSPDGSTLAVFAATGRTSDLDPRATLAVIGLRDGTVQLVGESFPVGEPRGWASWTPSGGALAFGGIDGMVRTWDPEVSEEPTIGAQLEAREQIGSAVVVSGS